MEKQIAQRRGGYLEAMLSSCPVAIMATNADGAITFANNEACKLVEREMSELIGAPITEVYENLSAAQETNRQIYMHGGTIRDHEAKIKTKRGKIINVRISASHMKDSAGNFLGAVGFFESFRPWTAAEEKLQSRIMELAADLEAWREQSAPIFELFPGIAASVLTGQLDPARCDRLTASLLSYLKNVRTRIVILDVASICECDESTARQILRTIRTVNLVGVQCILAGVQPRTAQALESLITDISAVRSYGSTGLALEAALDMIGYQIERK
ncbi:MAG: PAS domain-containing protein [Chloroflexi bacterium]|nr:PAS domain-containing protein [Chloroflexota bacterium]